MPLQLAPALSLPYEVGALYNRVRDIHGRFGGQRQGGISTPKSAPYVVLFTGEAGKQYGYTDFWDDEGVLHYFGEGQRGDMVLEGGNRAILRHAQDAKRLLVFQAMGKGKPYRFWGEFRCLDYYQVPGVPDTNEQPRVALVFRLRPLADDLAMGAMVSDPLPKVDLEQTVAPASGFVRRTQTLFRRRLLTVEKECRLTGVRDLRFLRASHIKPWSRCATGTERVDGQNGLLLTPTADLLFDRGWITFADDGKLIRSEHLPHDVITRVGLNLSTGRSCGAFAEGQRTYLSFHREAVFEKSFGAVSYALEEIERLRSV